MSKQFETGHAVNVANLEMLIEQVKTYTAYNPSIENLKIPELELLYNSAVTNLNTVKDKRTANKNAIAERQRMFDELKPKSTRIINQLDILSLNETTINQAKSLNRLIQGYTKRKNQIFVGEEEQNNTKSTSRQSYIQTAENFSKLLQLTATVEEFNPNVEDLKLTELTAYHTSLVNTTQVVNQTEAELNTALIERNTILYDNSRGLYGITLNVKKYVKSVYGASSPEYRKVSRIKFTDKKLVNS